MSKFEISSSQVFVNLNTRYSVDKFNDPVFELNWRQLPVCVNTSITYIERTNHEHWKPWKSTPHQKSPLLSLLYFCLYSLIASSNYLQLVRMKRHYFLVQSKVDCMLDTKYNWRSFSGVSVSFFLFFAIKMHCIFSTGKHLDLD